MSSNTSLAAVNDAYKIQTSICECGCKLKVISRAVTILTACVIAPRANVITLTDRVITLSYCVIAVRTDVTALLLSSL